LKFEAFSNFSVSFWNQMNVNWQLWLFHN